MHLSVRVAGIVAFLVGMGVVLVWQAAGGSGAPSDAQGEEDAGSRRSDEEHAHELKIHISYCGSGCLHAACKVSQGEMKYVLVSATQRDKVWGTDEYTTTSDVGTAAVHAGLIKEGDKAVVALQCNVERRKKPANLTGSTRHGIESLAQPMATETFVLRTVHRSSDGTLPALPRRTCSSEPCLFHACYAPGEVFDMVVTGSVAPGTVYGTHKYSFDSPVGVAAVHLGILADKETAVVTVTCSGPTNVLKGSLQNGVDSRDFNKFTPATFTLSSKRSVLVVKSLPSHSFHHASRSRAANMTTRVFPVISASPGHALIPGGCDQRHHNTTSANATSQLDTPTPDTPVPVTPAPPTPTPDTPAPATNGTNGTSINSSELDTPMPDAPVPGPTRRR